MNLAQSETHVLYIMLTIHMYTDQSHKSLFLDNHSSFILDIHTFDNGEYEEC